MGMTEESQGQNEEKFVEFVQRAARGYNEPEGSIPREEMWSSIVMARQKAAAERATRRRYVWAAVGMAATLAIGVAIGRMGNLSPAAPATSMSSTTTTAAEMSAAAANAYTVATREHMRRAEALFVTYANPQSNTKDDSLVAGWARDMLSSTRLLLDSPLSTDETRRRMLEDLERVLVQMVQISPAERDADVRANVERTIERKRMMSRLRSMQSASLISGS
jgi:hypothetical protein